MLALKFDTYYLRKFHLKWTEINSEFQKEKEKDTD